MERKYWEKMAPAYNEEIFDVLHNDKKGIIRAAIKKQAGPAKTVIDIGCAIGKWLPVLSPAFKKVMAVDISAKNLAIAGRNFRQLSNITYRQADMSAGKTAFRGYDLAVCINAILTDSLKKRTVFFSNLSACLKKNGTLILVVPSLDSWLLTRIIQHQWQVDKKLFNDRLPDTEAAARYKNMLQGNVEIDQVVTKHYLEEELKLLLGKEGFDILQCRKIEYDWSTEFVAAPRWLQEPRPWDWMVVAQKK